ncbi:hypothetical protein SAMN05880582_103213 [Rhizobium sp. RU20A]|uniref:DUF6665 family protein n=1 Tax=Rhizobium sp. RU20A TaxID=1907412 RepID=UPI000955F3D0|nr:DUF6665 family protein [Rhizobium sp. RU20A]SIQ74867.1 hypothetical protein SAMN05880582_103213 [Rhizobium sp. RU20A]
MSFRPPQSLQPGRGPDTGLGILEYELMSERADSLGRHGTRVETALAALAKGLDGGATGSWREDLLQAAADAVWSFFIQREICGLRNGRDVVQRYGIPPEVMARLGVVRKR